MSQFEFIKYEQSPGEKYLGIATVKLYGKIILRYKIVANKDGSSFFPACASYKLPGTDDQYISCFTLDSVSEKEELEGLIRNRVRVEMQKISSGPLNAFGAPQAQGYQQAQGAMGMYQPQQLGQQAPMQQQYQAPQQQHTYSDGIPF